MNPKYYGIGVGPGDPELVTVKAINAINNSDIICYITNADGYSMAYEIAAQYINASSQKLPIVITMCKDRSQTESVYDEVAEKIGQELLQGKSVSILCEGDPLFYASFIYLHQRLQQYSECEIIPGINSVSAAAAQTQTPLCVLAEKHVVLTGRNSDDEILAALNVYESVVILKAGAERTRLVKLINNSGRQQEAVYIEKATNIDEKIYSNLADIPETPGSYFSLFLCSKQRLLLRKK